MRIEQISKIDEVDNLMEKMGEICVACQEEEDGPKASYIEQILSIAEFIHQEYKEIHMNNECLQNNLEETLLEN